MTADEAITSQVSWRQGRQLLRQYLQEIGYTDTIIDVRSNRVRSLLGLEGTSSGEGQENGAGAEKRPVSATDQRRNAPPPKKSLAEAMMMEAESAVMANFDFLSGGMDVDDDDDMGDDLDDVDEDSGKKRGKGRGIGDEVDAETEEVLNEFSFLGAEDVGRSSSGEDKGEHQDTSGWSYTPRADDVNLGELAQLTVNNDADVSMDVSFFFFNSKISQVQGRSCILVLSV